ncbi:MAG: prolipoprotein diacylglyceryl transferase [Firmicutes bacterium]|jgi:phosphatidylglycerol:prolipoprotein diacylglycerol transferase|nr:prolipoprotein diacylglyceryl transferase [Bacillota bacterium]
MYPVLWETPYFSIYAYGLMISLGILISSILVLREAPRQGYHPDHILEAIIIVGISGLVGSRILFVILNWSYYRDDPIRILHFRSGGLSFYGAIILAIIGLLLWSRWRKLHFLKLADFLAPYMLLGYAFGRVGCFLNGCCYGKITDLFKGSQLAEIFPRHPVQLYASLGALALFFLVLYLRKYKFFEGYNFTLVILTYGLLRFTTGFFREDVISWLGLSFAQIFSMGLVVAMALLLWFKKRRKAGKS